MSFLQAIIDRFRTPAGEQVPEFAILFSKFQQILEGNNTVLEVIAQMEDKLSGEYIFDMNYIRSSSTMMSEAVYKIIYALNVLSNNHYPELFARHEAIQLAISDIIEGQRSPASGSFVLSNDRVGMDVEDLVGGKSARLGEIRNHLKLKTPEGFVITTAAYHAFMRYNKLWPQIHAMVEKAKSDESSSQDLSRRIEHLFEKAVVPPRLKKEIGQALGGVSKRLRKKGSFAVRSSACGEDSEEKSFAGQFQTLLNQRAADIASAYKKVLASRFSESILAYHGDLAFDEQSLPMAVACQAMIPGRVSGVTYTVDPSGTAWDRLLIAAVFGLGEAAVAGKTNMDQYVVSRYHPFKILDQRISVKETSLLLSPEGSIQEETIPECEREVSCLPDDRVFELAQLAMTLERYFKRPQDIEWTVDADGQLVVLQSRPLALQDQRAERDINLTESLQKYPVLIADQGQIVQRGVAAGKVVRVTEDDDPIDFPPGAIAVTRYTSPRLTKIIRRTSAIVTDVGSPTGHMATIAREFRVPTIVGTEKATKLLKDGMEITVDADENKIYEGIVPEVLEYEMEGKDQFTNLAEFKILKRILNKVAPLTLIDPTSSAFTAGNCQTFHDILRFCHEKAVWELIHLHTSEKRFRDVKARELKLSVPIGLHVIDTGNGLTDDVGEDTVDSIDQVKSVPMRAILEGLTAPGAWSTEPRALQFNDFMSSLTRFSLTGPQPLYTGRNLAVISERYANLSLRLGYHFNVIDTYVSENINDNYIYFRFVGGVTEPERRYRRGVLIQLILERYDFKAVLKNDLVVARIKKRGHREMRNILVVLGKLIGFTRQLDTEMISDKSIEKYVHEFLDENLDTVEDE